MQALEEMERSGKSRLRFASQHPHTLGGQLQATGREWVECACLCACVSVYMLYTWKAERKGPSADRAARRKGSGRERRRVVISVEMCPIAYLAGVDEERPGGRRRE